MHWLNKSFFLVNVHRVPTAVFLRHRSKADSSREAGRGWWVQTHPREHLMQPWKRMPSLGWLEPFEGWACPAKGSAQAASKKSVMQVMMAWERHWSWESSVVIWAEGHGRMERSWNEDRTISMANFIGQLIEPTPCPCLCATKGHISGTWAGRSWGRQRQEQWGLSGGP